MKSEVRDFTSLYEWSIRNPREFWMNIWKFCHVVASHRPSEVVRDLDKMPGAKWFPDARLNFAENLLRHRDDRAAIAFWNEHGAHSRLTYHQLYQRVAQVVSAFRKLGLRPGDRVAGSRGAGVLQATARALATPDAGVSHAEPTRTSYKFPVGTPLSDLQPAATNAAKDLFDPVPLAEIETVAARRTVAARSLKCCRTCLGARSRTVLSLRAECGMAAGKT